MIDYDMKKKFDRMESRFEWFSDSVTKTIIYILSGVAFAGIVVSVFLYNENTNLTYEKELIKQRDSLYIDALLNVDLRQDSVINGMPPVNIEIDEECNYSFTYN